MGQHVDTYNNQAVDSQQSFSDSQPNFQFLYYYYYLIG